MAQHGLMGYNQFKASQAAKGVNIVGGDGSYNRYTASYASGGSALNSPAPQKSGGNLPSGVYMVNLGGAGKVRSDSVFTGVGGGVEGQTMTAGQMVNKQNDAGGRMYFDTAPTGNIQAYGMSDLSDEAWEIQSQKYSSPVAKIPSPVASPSQRSSPSPSPAPKPFKQTKPKQKERDAITPPAKGLENTIKTSTRSLTERRRRSYLSPGTKKSSSYLTS